MSKCSSNRRQLAAAEELQTDDGQVGIHGFHGFESPVGICHGTEGAEGTAHFFLSDQTEDGGNGGLPILSR